MSKYPLGQEEDYIEKLKEIYSDYRENVEENLKQRKSQPGYDENSLEGNKELYDPKVYHLFSQFDVALISLVNNFKFPQRVFEPAFITGDKMKTVSYQILSGSILKSQSKSTPYEVINEKNNFLKIIQLKINNGLLIGNGNSIFAECIIQIEAVLHNRNLDKYILIDSFNWAELILVISDSCGENIANALMEIRSLRVLKIEEGARKAIVDDSLYNLWEVATTENAHLFTETHSFLAVNYDDYGTMEDSKKLKSIIEWKIKPGHLPYFLDALDNIELTIQTDAEKVVFKTGKTDYVIESFIETETISLNQKIFSGLRKKGNPLIKHIRRLKTDPLFNLDPRNMERLKEDRGKNVDFPSNDDHLLKYRISESSKVSDYLKKLNVSRNIRKKIHKIIYNYHLGIQDTVLFIYFIDLRPLLVHFISILKFYAEHIESTVIDGTLNDISKIDDFGIFRTYYIEDKLESYINVFEEAIQDRILNNYNYEDINEFNLDINSSLSGIVSSLDALIKFYGVSFRNKDDNTLVTTINDKETLSNKINVNYNVEHITSPPLIFSTLLKEISNVKIYKFGKETENFKSALIKELDKKLTEDQKECLTSNYLNYFEADYKKYRLTFFDDRPLFIWWHWAYALQNTHLYNSLGCFGEDSFKTELFRLLLIVQIKDYLSIRDLACPLPELQGYWDKHFNRLRNLVKIITECDSFAPYLESLNTDITNTYVHLSKKDEKAFQKNDAYSTFEDFKSTVKVASKKPIDEFATFFLSEVARSPKRYFFDQEIDRAKEPVEKAMIEALNVFVKPKFGKQKPGAIVENTLFKVSSYLSYYSLRYLYDKFGNEITLLRRDFSTGMILPHFLETENVYFIDPFGGFFVNDVEEMNDYMRTFNTLISLMRHLGNVLKIRAFMI